MITDSTKNNTNNCEDEIYEMRNRIKEDIFHRFQDMSLPKSCTIKLEIIMLLTPKTLKYYKKYYKELKEVLRLKGVSNFQ